MAKDRKEFIRNITTIICCATFLISGFFYYKYYNNQEQWNVKVWNETAQHIYDDDCHTEHLHEVDWKGVLLKTTKSAAITSACATGAFVGVEKLISKKDKENNKSTKRFSTEN